jgi:hypothetical protein
MRGPGLIAATVTMKGCTVCQWTRTPTYKWGKKQ